MDNKSLRALAEAAEPWKMCTARQPNGAYSGQAELGQEIDGDFYSVAIIDTGNYEAPEAAMKLANFYAAANPAAILALLDRVKALECGLTKLMRNFPTDDDMIESGWTGDEIEAACSAHDAASALLENKHE